MTLRLSIEFMHCISSLTRWSETCKTIPRLQTIPNILIFQYIQMWPTYDIPISSNIQETTSDVLHESNVNTMLAKFQSFARLNPAGGFNPFEHKNTVNMEIFPNKWNSKLIEGSKSSPNELIAWVFLWGTSPRLKKTTTTISRLWRLKVTPLKPLILVGSEQDFHFMVL